MPMIQISYAPGPATPTGIEPQLADLAARLAERELGKDPAVTAVAIQRIDPAHWFCGGQPLAEQDLAGFWLDIRVTEGTNDKTEKAAFIAATFAGMGELLGPLHGESYVHVVEARADSYGYGGRTQERRYIEARPL
ncbi:4-oxalocrotonate tautomerase family protein [Ancylobacter sonchi]|uniref:tautomerase family protein n=1 Tax=Ancylobacter sonchi TaxID=1937790 RepID=UPI001BD6C638|nr:4-oxalocrotonate tautomerase family protein [Ancylobacter sonchi]MBS7534991.1 4-oxalocrotonate tautomerase family protein [Ancylobacter sonchi]